MNVFHHHDGVVDQNTDGKNQREQRYAIQRKAPGPRGEQGGRQGQYHRNADNHRLAFTQGEEHQRHYQGRSEQQLVDEFLGFIVRRLAIVAGDGDIHAFRQHRALELIHAGDDTARHIHGVLAGLFRYRNRHCRIFPWLGDALGFSREATADPYIAGGLIRAIHNSGDITHEHRLVVGHTDH